MKSFLFLLRYSALSLVRHRWVFLLTLLGVSTGTAVVTAVLLANKSALLSFQNAVSHVQGKTDYSVRSSAGDLFSDRVLDRLERLSPAPPLSLSPLLSRTVRYNGSLFWIRGVDFLGSVDRLSRGGSFAGLIREGAYLPPGGLRKFHLHPGDRMRVLYGTRLIDVPVLGEIPRSESVSLIPDNTLFMDLAWAQMMFDLPGKISRIDLSWQTSPPSRPWKALWKDEIRHALGPSLVLVSDREKHKEFSRLLFSYRSNLFALSLVSLIVGMFLIYNTLSLLTLQGRKTFSTLRLLGVTPREIQAIVLLEGGIIGLGGGLLGIIGGHLLSRLTIGAVARTLDTLYLPVGILPHFRTTSEDFEVWALTVLASLASSVFPAREALRLPPVFSQHRTTLESAKTSGRGRSLFLGGLAFLTGLLFLDLPPIHGFPLFGYLGALLWVFSASLAVPSCVGWLSRILRGVQRLSGRESSPGLLALSHFESGVSRSQIAISSVMIGLSMMTGIVILVHSFEMTLNLWISQNLVADLYVKPLSCQEAVCRERLGRCPGHPESSRSRLCRPICLFSRPVPGSSGLGGVYRAGKAVPKGPSLPGDRPSPKNPAGFFPGEGCSGLRKFCLSLRKTSGRLPDSSHPPWSAPDSCSCRLSGLFLRTGDRSFSLEGAGSPVRHEQSDQRLRFSEIAGSVRRGSVVSFA